MLAELSVALEFIISHLYNKLPRRRVDVFKEELERGFVRRFDGHWYPEEPSKGSGFRCVKLAADKVDPVVDAAARASGLDIAEIKTYLPAGLTIWIDPREVSYRVSEHGPVQVIYRGGARRSMEGGEDGADGEVQRVSWSATGAAFDVVSGGGSLFTAGRSMDLSPSPNWTHGSGGTSPIATGSASLHGRLPAPPATTCFTAATFAQTKFGSTKMKSQGPQRPSRLSPIEATGFISRLSPTCPGAASAGLAPGGWGLSPTAAVAALSSPGHLSPMQPTVGLSSPGDPRMNALQDWLLMQQQHQQQQVQLLAALQQQQQQRIPAQSTTWAGFPGPMTSNIYQHQMQQMSQRQQPKSFQPSSSSPLTSPDISLLFPSPTDAADIMGISQSTLGISDNPMASSPAATPLDDVNKMLAPPSTTGGNSLDSVDWGFEMAMPAYAAGLQQLLLAN